MIGQVEKARCRMSGDPDAALYQVATMSKGEGESEPSRVAYAVPVIDRTWVEARAGERHDAVPHLGGILDGALHRAP
jgi:hypothetical protein